MAELQQKETAALAAQQMQNVAMKEQQEEEKDGIAGREEERVGISPSRRRMDRESSRESKKGKG